MNNFKHNIVILTYQPLAGFGFQLIIPGVQCMLKKVASNGIRCFTLVRRQATCFIPRIRSGQVLLQHDRTATPNCTQVWVALDYMLLGHRMNQRR
jgi:hypothetical protein